LAAKQISGVGRQIPGANDLKPSYRRRWNGRVANRTIVLHHAEKANLRIKIQKFMLFWLPEIVVDQYGPVAALGKGDGKIGKRNALLIVTRRRRDKKRLDRAFNAAKHQVCPQAAIGLGRG